MCRQSMSLLQELLHRNVTNTHNPRCINNQSIDVIMMYNGVITSLIKTNQNNSLCLDRFLLMFL